MSDWIGTPEQVRSFMAMNPDGDEVEVVESRLLDESLRRGTARAIKAGEARGLLGRAYEVIRRREVRIDADCSGESPLCKEIKAHLAGV